MTKNDKIERTHLSSAERAVTDVVAYRTHPGGGVLLTLDNTITILETLFTPAQQIDMSPDSHVITNRYSADVHSHSCVSRP